MRAEEKFEATKQAELTGVLTKNHQDAWKSFPGRTLRRNGYRNVKVGSVRESLDARDLWSSLDYLCASKKEKRVSLGLYIARGKKGNHSRSRILGRISAVGSAPRRWIRET